MGDQSTNKIHLQISEEYDPTEWNALVGNLPYCSILQSWQWGDIKSRYNWGPIFFQWTRNGDTVAAALALVRKKQFGLPITRFQVMYIPHGPLLAWDDNELRTRVLADLQSYAGENHYAFIKIDPQIPIAIGIEGEPGYQVCKEGLETRKLLQQSGWLLSNQQIQFKNTFFINLLPMEDEILASMRQKTRYNIRLAGRKGVKVRELGISELDALYNMYAATSLRDGFVIRARDYYLDIWGNMLRANMGTALLAEVEKKPIAGLVMFYFGKKSYYFYGMSFESHREKMPNHLLQWEAIKLSIELDCKEYDLWGAPDEFNKQDRMWGVQKFKQGFGGKMRQTAGAFDFPNSKVKYKLLAAVLPNILSIMRRQRFRQLRQESD